MNLLTIPEVADRLRVSSDTVERMLSDGELAFIRIRRQRRVSEDDLRAFLSRERQPAAAELQIERRAQLHALGVKLPRLRRLAGPAPTK